MELGFGVYYFYTDDVDFFKGVWGESDALPSNGWDSGWKLYLSFIRHGEAGKPRQRCEEIYRMEKKLLHW